MRLKIFKYLTLLFIASYALVMLYILSGPISVMMWVNFVGAGLVFFALPSLILGIWGTIEFKRAIDLPLKQKLKLLIILALIPFLTTLVGWMISMFLAILHPPHVN